MISSDLHTVDRTPARRRRGAPARLIFGAVAVGGLLVAVPVVAHDGPDEVIERLTLKMQRQGRSAELLYQRATEYRTLGKLKQATVDLNDALRRSPKHFAAWLELSRIQLAQSDAEAALASIGSALKCASTTERPVALVQRAAALAATDDFSAALADVNAAIEARSDQVDWYLQRSILQSKLGQLNERVAGLKVGWRVTDSAALRVSMIDAMIDAGQVHEALELVEPELADARFTSSWLIRRARCRLQLSEPDAAAEDLRAAIAEINPRIHPQRPDVSLIVDRGFAFALLGEIDQARADLKTARMHRADEWLTERLERAVNEKG